MTLEAFRWVILMALKPFAWVIFVALTWVIVMALDMCYVLHTDVQKDI